jgi:hypothetical protein
MVLEKTRSYCRKNQEELQLGETPKKAEKKL